MNAWGHPKVFKMLLAGDSRFDKIGGWSGHPQRFALSAIK